MISSIGALTSAIPAQDATLTSVTSTNRRASTGRIFLLDRSHLTVALTSLVSLAATASAPASPSVGYVLVPANK
jgi:hypothetical protein